MSQFKGKAPAPLRPHVSLRLRELAASVTSLNMDMAKLTDRCLRAEARVAELEAENEELGLDLAECLDSDEGVARVRGRRAQAAVS